MSRLPRASAAAIHETVARYYSEKLREHGPTPRGVDWNSAESQRLRFAALLRLVDGDIDGAFSINDYGCGYGALADYLVAMDRPFTYRGFDISRAMIDTARARHAGNTRCVFTSEAEVLAPADYTVASGIFNVKLRHDDEEWRAYVWETIERLAALSQRGFAFNMLSTYSDVDKRRADLHYADPLDMFDRCKRQLSPQVALLHDYGLYEFTVLVRK
jgi:SAM-dependent methyltransferase